MMPESPVEDKPAATVDQQSQSSSYDDSKPELAVPDLSADKSPVSPTPEPKAEQAPPPAEPKAEAEKPAAETVSHASDAKPESDDKPEPKDHADREANGDGPDVVKPEGRLLPWEPPAQSPESVEQDTADEDQPKQ